MIKIVNKTSYMCCGWWEGKGSHAWSDQDWKDGRYCSIWNKERFCNDTVKGPIHDSDLQSQPQFPTATSTKFPVYGLQQPHHHCNLQVAVAVAVDQNFLIFGGRSLKSRLRLRCCMGRSDQICHISANICMLLN